MADLPSLDQTTENGIPYAVVEGPFIGHSSERTTGREVYRIARENVELFLLESIPAPSILNGFVSIGRRRRMPSSGFLITKNVNVGPFVGDKPADLFNAYGNPTTNRWARVEIEYEAALESDDNERDPEDPISFLERSVVVGFEQMAVNSRNVTFLGIDVDGGGADCRPGGGAGAEASKDVNVGIVKLVPTQELQFRWPYALNPDWTTITETLGKVNGAEMDELFMFAKKQTCMFMGCAGAQKFLWGGGLTRVEPWDLTFHYSIRSVNEDGKTFGWNHVYRPDTGCFEKVLRRNGRDLFEEGNLTAVFRART